MHYLVHFEYRLPAKSRDILVTNTQKLHSLTFQAKIIGLSREFPDSNSELFCLVQLLAPKFANNQKH